jgi:hypothetical protein
MLGQNGTSPILAHTDEIQRWSTCRQSGARGASAAAPDPQGDMGGGEIPQRRVSCTTEVCYPFPGGQEADQVRMKRRAFITLLDGAAAA